MSGASAAASDPNEKWQRVVWRMACWMHFCRRKITAVEAMGVMFPKRLKPVARRDIEKRMMRCCHPAAAWQKGGNQAASWEVCSLCGARMSYWDRTAKGWNVAAKLYLERTVCPMASNAKPVKPKMKMKGNPEDEEGWEVMVLDGSEGEAARRAPKDDKVDRMMECMLGLQQQQQAHMEMMLQLMQQTHGGAQASQPSA